MTFFKNLLGISMKNNWDYSQLVKATKTLGGPKKAVQKLYGAGVVSGTVIVGGIGTLFYLVKQRKIKEDISDGDIKRAFEEAKNKLTEEEALELDQRTKDFLEKIEELESKGEDIVELENDYNDYVEKLFSKY